VDEANKIKEETTDVELTTATLAGVDARPEVRAVAGSTSYRNPLSGQRGSTQFYETHRYRDRSGHARDRRDRVCGNGMV